MSPAHFLKTCSYFRGISIPIFNQEDRGQYLISELHLSTHTGTHIDAPVHYLKTGGTIDTVPLSHLIGKCRVLDVSEAGTTITADHLNGRLDGVRPVPYQNIIFRD